MKLDIPTLTLHTCDISQESRIKERSTSAGDHLSQEGQSNILISDHFHVTQTFRCVPRQPRLSMGDSSPTSSPGVLTRAMARSVQSSPTSTSSTSTGTSRSSASATASSATPARVPTSPRSRSGSNTGSVPGSPRKKEAEKTKPKTQVELTDDSSSDSDLPGSGRRPVNQERKITGKSPPSSGRRAKAVDRGGAGDANGHQEGIAGGEGEGIPPSAQQQQAPPPAGAPEEPLWLQAWNLFNDNPGLKLAGFIALFALVLALIFGAGGSSNSTTTPAPSPTGQLFFTKSAKLLFKKQFASQSLDTQLSLLAQGEAMLDTKTPRQPSAIAVLYPPGVSHDFTACMVRKIGSVLNQAFENYEPVKELTAQQFTTAPDVSSIHADLKAYFHRGGRAVIFDGMDRLTREEHLNVLHAFTDNFRAPEKRATYFFLLAVPERVYDTRLRAQEWKYEHGGDIVYQLLNSAWKSVVSEDKRPAIIARVSPTVILLQEGDQCWN